MTTDNDYIELPQDLLDLLPTLPATIDRKAGAQLVTDRVFPTSAKTVKAWPLPWQYPNGRAIAPPASYLAYACRKARRAPNGIGLGRHTADAVPIIKPTG
jgi:hypothetical protein